MFYVPTNTVQVPWGSEHSKAFKVLKNKLCLTPEKALQIVNFTKPGNLQVDDTGHWLTLVDNYTISVVLTQLEDEGTEMPITG